MEIGTVEPISDQPRKMRRKHRSSGGGSGKPGPGGGGPNGGDGPGPNPSGSEYSGVDPNLPDKSRVVMWFLLLVVMMTFGGLIGAYVVIATNGQNEWQPFKLPFQVWISTAIILASSVTYNFAQRAIFADDTDAARRWLISTTVLGAAFISSQLIVWLSLYSQGVYMRGNPYAGFFYILTAVHAVHILGGVIALGVIQIRTWHPTANEPELKYRRDVARAVGWFWHFMAFIWIALIVLLGQWK